jgi:hypothetical protein
VVSDKTVCSRLANDGLFLLDTVFQTSSNLSSTAANLINEAKQLKTLELNINDATTLLNAFKSIEFSSETSSSQSNLTGLDNLVHQIEKQLSSLNPYDQWATVKLTESYSNLLLVLTHSLEETKRNNLQSVSIPIFSLLLDRLYRLDSSLIETQIQNSMPITFTNFDKRYMCSEATRRATFNEWPHMDYKWVLPDALAQSGFYHQPTHPGDDRTICFVCDLCLVAWEQHDQPWFVPLDFFFRTFKNKQNSNWFIRFLNGIRNLHGCRVLNNWGARSPIHSLFQHICVLAYLNRIMSILTEIKNLPKKSYTFDIVQILFFKKKICMNKKFKIFWDHIIESLDE